MSVMIEKLEDESVIVGVVIHTENADENFVIALTHEKAMKLSRDLFIAAKAAESGDLSPNPNIN